MPSRGRALLSRLGVCGVLAAACGDPTVGVSGGETEACPEGSEACPCASDESCDPGLRCYSGLCVDPGETTGGTTSTASSGATESSSEASESSSTSDPSGSSETESGPSECGNGIVDVGEECDVGTESSECDGDCTLPECGDGVTNEASLEVCDDAGESSRCNADCTAAECGDGVHNAAAGEACDDANADDTDACVSGCVAATCGDGYVWAGMEECDDGDGIDTDLCPATCEDAFCGDSYVLSGIETCDDGNLVDTDGCPTSCVPAFCGDGFVRSGVETCDDGNLVDTDACPTSCVAAFCGDGFAQTGIEECDDGNEVADDGCENDCTISPVSCGAPGDVIYVDGDAAGANDGSSWVNAFDDISLALQAAGTNDELWIAEGTYTAAAANAPVATLVSCVRIYGGFVGTETSIDERPTPLAVTTLSGDFNGNDGAGSFADNAVHVVVADAVDNVVIDGITIRAGRATGAGQSADGAGLFALSSALELVDVTFVDNVAHSEGGGLYASASMLELHGCTFVDNMATTAGATGGGAFATASTVALTSATFTSNFATFTGGGIRVLSGSSLTVEDGWFETNGVDTAGGALQANDSTVAISESFVLGNTSGNDGGGVSTSGTAPVTIANTHFEGNVAADYGGALVLNSPGSSTNVTFVNNSAAHGGNAVSRNGHTHALIDVEFVGNVVDGFGVESGGALVILGGPTSVTNALFEGNSSVDFGGAISVASGDDFSLENAILENNTSGNGGGLSIQAAGIVTMAGVSFSNNIATTCGGAIYGAAGGAASTVTVDASDFTQNGATGVGADGGAICTVDTDDGPTFSIDSSRFTENSAADDGGAVYGGGPMRIRNVAFRANDSGGDGGAVRASTRTNSPQILSSSFYENSAIGNGGGVSLVVGAAGTSGIVRNCAMWANGSDMTGEANATITYTCSEEFLSASAGNQLSASDPFVIGTAGELFLDQLSACVDNGDDIAATADYTAIGLDWSQLTTSSDGTLDTSPVDMGVHYSP